MPYELHRYQQQQAYKSASQLVPYTVVVASGIDKGVIINTNASQRPVGVVGASAAPGAQVTVYEMGNIVKAIAAASVGFGAEVAIASLGVSTQVQGGTQLATTTLLGLASGLIASGTTGWTVGTSQSAAQAGEVFSVLINPRQLFLGSPA
jgi:hypothetical protein